MVLKTIPSAHILSRRSDHNTDKADSFALERHLKRVEVIHPRRQLGNFRGEPVFPRSSVVTLKSADNFMREGRRIKAGEQPLKMVKAMAVTINRRREQAAAEAEGQEAPLQPLYAEWQAELLIPRPIKDVRILPNHGWGYVLMLSLRVIFLAMLTATWTFSLRTCCQKALFTCRTRESPRSPNSLTYRSQRRS